MISRSQCVLAGGTPASNLTSVQDRNAVNMGLGFYWEKADDAAFTIGVVSNLSANSQTLVMGAHAANTYYRRVVPTGLAAPNDFYYSNTVKISIVGATNTPAFIPTSVSPICEGTSSFTVSYNLLFSAARYSIIWDAAPSALGFVDVVEQNLPGSSPLTVNVPTTAPVGSYSGTLIPFDVNGCSTAGGSNSFTFNALPVVNAITGNNAVCVGSNITLANTTAGGVWSSNTPANGTIDGLGVLTGVSNGATTISYTVTDGNGCVNSATAVKTINPLPAVNAITGNNNVCVGSTITLANTTAGGVWSSGTPANGTIDGSGVLTGVANGTTIISYTVTDINSCVNSATAVKTINPLPTVNAITGNNSVCVGSTITLANITAGGVWSSGTPANGTIDGSGVLTGVANGTTIISYTVTDINSCVNSATAVKTINPLPSVNAITGNNSVCVGSTITLANTTAGGVWSSGTPANGTISGAGVLTGVTNGTTTISYTVTDINSCVNSATAVKTINPLPSVNAITGNNSVCVGSTITLANTTAGGVWSSGTPANGTISGAGVLTGVTNGTTTISYTVTDINSCVNSATAVKTINSLPSVNITNPAAVCAPGVIDLTSVNITSAGSTANLSYTQWNNALATSALTNASSITASGIYYIKGTIPATGCSVTQPVTATINPLPIVNVTNPGAVCAPSVVDLTAANTTTGSTAGLVYTQWNNALATSALTNASSITASGIYYIKGTIPATGCSVTQPVTATINPLPIVTITNPAAVCAPGVIDLTSVNITSAGSMANLSYTQWNNALATSALTNASSITASGIYYIKGTIPATGCSVTQPVTATINPLPIVTITNPAAVCAPGVIDLTSVNITSAGSTANLSYTRWNNALATSALTNASSITASGVYFPAQWDPKLGIHVT